jgi:hypothetical protein
MVNIKTQVKMLKNIINETYSASIGNVNMGFTLAAALAWNEAVKALIRSKISIKQTGIYHGVFAMIMTLIAALASVLTTKFLKPSHKTAQISPVIGMSR